MVAWVCTLQPQGAEHDILGQAAGDIEDGGHENFVDGEEQLGGSMQLNYVPGDSGDLR